MFKARTNPFQHLSSYQNLERDGGLDWSSEDSTMRSLGGTPSAPHPSGMRSWARRSR